MRALLAGMDLCINGVPTMAGYQMDIFEACFEARVHYIDYGGLGVYTVKQKAEHARWRDAGLSAILSCGADPGMSNMICKAVAERLDTIERINLYWAASVDGPDSPVLVPPYAVSTVLAEYALPSQQFFDGELREVPAMSGREIIELPAPWGTTEFIHSIHSEQLTVPFADGIADKGIREFTWKLSLPQREHDTWAALMRVGFRDFEDPIAIGGVEIKPGDFLTRLITRNMERYAEEIPEQAGHEIHFADGAGTKDGQPFEVRCAVTSGPDPLYDDYLDAGTSMNMSIAAQLLLATERKPGVWGPEEYFEVEPYFAELEKRHFNIYRSG
jgi:saccharopine dehydrogenase-like NADP-dependent oxidoreductase